MARPTHQNHLTTIIPMVNPITLNIDGNLPPYIFFDSGTKSPEIIYVIVPPANARHAETATSEIFPITMPK